VTSFFRQFEREMKWSSREQGEKKKSPNCKNYYEKQFGALSTGLTPALGGFQVYEANLDKKFIFEKYFEIKIHTELSVKKYTS